ncbi:hypothetical protein N5D36_22260 [Pseudomonas mosselii]|uniref:hypothetical protein n=1 Tax=Pseudomonas mosselii TaxID=78327 RepID=UPI002446B503|nr:hypothetical protein [Pseudomonas mosselii]MDH0627057.1 hypothetical protein [Pseudomonas mosselii]MDH0680177.1 hypothetical protein [Pseudomonas mosselii]MDH0924952.1 hypothetical protein [Pseudomonas mosselii]MDH1136028.1 hypothetical protein [Pseudomonas mosselii]MDH1140291.1 hypothetical protein [Pseudomonas mosselii]
MTLHLSKYSSKIIKSAATEDFISLRKNIVDSMIIILSSANIFNFIIASNYTDSSAKTPHELGNLIASQYIEGKHGLTLEIAIEFSSMVGIMCKAVESLDHLEAWPFRESLTKSLSHLFEHTLSLASIIGISDIASEISDRLYYVEQKNPYFEELGNYKEGYK